MNPSKNADKTPQTILIIEDDAPDQALAKERLKSIWPQCNLIFAQSIRRSYQILKRRSVDMILLDLNMPDSYGPNTIKTVRSLNKTVPIVAMTGFLTPITADESLKQGASHIIQKSDIMNNAFTQILTEAIA